MNRKLLHLLILILTIFAVEISAQEVINNKFLPVNQDMRKKGFENIPKEKINLVLHKPLNQNDYRQTEVLGDTWENEQWNEEERTLYTYDSEDNLIEEKFQILNGTSWVNEHRINYSYENGNRTFIEHYEWNGTEWLNAWRNVTAYDGNGYSISYSLEIGDSLSWINQWRYLYYPNEINHLIDSTLFQHWYNSDWENSYLTKYFYTSDGRDSLIVGYNTPDTEWEPEARRMYTYDDALSYEEILELWSGTEWENEAWYSYTHDGNGNLLEEFGRLWEDSDWENWYRDIYSYNAQNQNTEFIRQLWNGLGWRTDWRYFYEYDSNNNRTLFRRENYNFGVWVGLWQYLYEYDSNNLLTISTYQDWDGTAWINDSRERYFYEPSTGVEEEVIASEFHLYNNYPNPFNPNTTIQFAIPQSSLVTLEVFNVLGESVGVLVSEVMSAGTHNYSWNASNLTSGIYIYQVTAVPLSGKQAGDFKEAKKMILLK